MYLVKKSIWLVNSKLNTLMAAMISYRTFLFKTQLNWFNLKKIPELSFDAFGIFRYKRYVSSYGVLDFPARPRKLIE